MDAIVVIDDRFRTMFANRAAELDLVGESPGGATGMDGLSLIHPDDHGGLIEVMAGLLLRAGSTDVTRFRVRTRTGWMWVEANATNLLGDPDVAGIVVASEHHPPAGPGTIGTPRPRYRPRQPCGPHRAPGAGAGRRRRRRDRTPCCSWTSTTSRRSTTAAATGLSATGC